MGQEAIRDVVIRVALQQTAAQFKVPDIAPQVQAQKQALDQVASHAKTLTPAMMTAINSPHIQAIKNIDLRVKAEQEAANLIAKDRLKEITMAERIAAFQREKAGEAIEATRKIQDANIKAAQAARSLGESSMLAVRGFVMLGASGNKEVEKIVHSLLMVQGAVDVYKGLSGILLGVARAYQAVAASSAAAAVAQRAAASAGGMGGAAAAGAGAGIGGGLLGGLAGAGGLAGLGLAFGVPAGIGVGAMGAGYAYSKWREGQAQLGADRADASRLNRRDELDFVRRRETEASNIAFADSNLRMQNQFGVAGRERGFDLSESGVGFSEATSGLGRARTTAGRFAGQAAQSRALAAQRGLLGRQGGDIAGELAKAQAQRADAVARLGGLTEGHGGEAFQEQRQAALQQRLEAEKNIQAALERQQQNRIQQLQTQRQSLELARDQLQAEKDRVSGISRGLGSLNEGELAEAKRIAAKVKAGGDVSREELTFLEKSGAFGEFTGKEREKLGARANAGGEFDVLTGGASQVARLEDELAKLTAGTAENSKTIVDLLKEIKTGRDEEVKALKELADSTLDLDKVAAVINRMQAFIDLITKAEARRAALK